MCGIIAGISPKIVDILLLGLKQLQNRGYDSFGSSSLVKKNNEYEYSIYKVACTQPTINFNTFTTKTINWGVHLQQKQ